MYFLSTHCWSLLATGYLLQVAFGVQSFYVLQSCKMKNHITSRESSDFKTYKQNSAQGLQQLMRNSKMEVQKSCLNYVLHINKHQYYFSESIIFLIIMM